MTRCDVLDVLEAAIVTRTAVEVATVDGARQVVRPVAIAARDGDDRVALDDGTELAVSAIDSVKPIAPRGV